MTPNYLRLFLRLFGILAVVSLTLFLFGLKPAASEEMPGIWQTALMKYRAENSEASVLEFAAEFPIVADWISQDLPGGLPRFFAQSGEGGTDLNLVRRVLQDIRRAGGATIDLEERFDLLSGNEGLNPESRVLALYLEACQLRRKVRLSDFLKSSGPIVFAQHANFKMSFLGYTEGLSDARKERFFKPGAKLSLLHFDDAYGEVEHLIEDPYGLIRDVDVSPDGRRIIFAWKKSDRLDDYHIYEYHLDQQEVQQLTGGISRADYEPVYLPDGDIVFTSTRPEQSVPCWWTEISNLYRMSGQGRYLRRLTVDQVHSLYPQVMEDGRVIYTRWEYSDRGQQYPHPLFYMNPDGMDQRVFYEGNSRLPNSLLHARAIPGTDKVMAVVAGQQARQYGKVVVLDAQGKKGEGRAMEFVAPRREIPYEQTDPAFQKGGQFRYPYPLNEREFLVSFLPEKDQVDYPAYGDDGVYGLYWMDVDGNRELLYADEQISVGRPVPIQKPFEAVMVPDMVDYSQQTGVYYVHDVYDGQRLKGVDHGEAKFIRVVRLNFPAAGVGMTLNKGAGGGAINSTPVAIGNGSWDVKEIIGDVEIHEDGSVMFEVPAMAPVYLQVLDDQKQVIQTTRSWDSLRPGEKKACRGLGSAKQTNFYEFKEEATMAWEHGAQKPAPFYGPPRGFSFTTEIQPILDKKCISCHDGSRIGVMNLTGEIRNQKTVEQRFWTESYLNLTHAVKKRHSRGKYEYYLGDSEHEMVNWINKMSEPTELAPYSRGAVASEIMTILREGHQDAALSEEELHKFAAWLDLLVPFSGDYREAADWSLEDMAYYNYYEHKRRLNTEEETANIREWMLAKDNEIAARILANNQEEEGPAGYRPLEGEFAKSADNTWELNLGREVMIDRIEMDFETGTEGLASASTVLVTLSDQTTLRKDFASGEHAFVISLGVPRNTHGLRLDLKEGDGWTNLKNIRVWGRDMSELPYFEMYHPYLQLGDNY